MKVTCIRDIRLPTATGSILAVDGRFFGFCLEDEDRGLSVGQSVTEMQKRKIKEETAIPYGTYTIAWTMSNRWRRMMMELVDVPVFQGIRPHGGNVETHTAGCPLVGLHRTVVDIELKITDSSAAVEWLTRRFLEDKDKGIPSTWEVTPPTSPPTRPP